MGTITKVSRFYKVNRFSWFVIDEGLGKTKLRLKKNFIFKFCFDIGFQVFPEFITGISFSETYFVDLLICVDERI